MLKLVMCCWLCKHLEIDFSAAYGTGDETNLYYCKTTNLYMVDPFNTSCSSFELNKQLVKD